MSEHDGVNEAWAESMDGLDVSGCTRCEALVDSRSRIVNGVGPADVDILFVGEAPGAREDAEGEPFVGRSGEVLEETLRTVGLEREIVRITNCLRCRPPDNRDPHAGELAHCRGYLEREIELVAPELLVTLGKVPAEHLLERDVAVRREAGEIVEATFGDRRQRVLLCLHPAATLYDRSQAPVFEETLRTAAEYTDAEAGQSKLGEF